MERIALQGLASFIENRVAVAADSAEARQRIIQSMFDINIFSSSSAIDMIQQEQAPTTSEVA
jgi:hypothetical protein